MFAIVIGLLYIDYLLKKGISLQYPQECVMFMGKCFAISIDTPFVFVWQLVA